MKQLWEFGYAVRALHARLKHGELSRSPLRFLKFEWKIQTAECHWVARLADQWDVDLPPDIRERHASLQALGDAIVVRRILFEVLPAIESATLRVYRVSAREPCELIISGEVSREKEPGPNVASVAMRAKLLGFQFSMDDGVLEALQGGERSLEVTAYK
ncbi:MAG TPA: hypothetical protein VMB47_15310 [Candidatus Aquilonibacter sp.]|nr:hypothetical protein [Candidatus Aquilonibacter sp.]